jgi:molecular chaperone GrpE
VHREKALTDAPRPEEPVIIRDKRKIDRPKDEQEAAGTDQVSAAAPGGSPVTEAETADLQAQLDERTADLQRLQAEYANYRRRAERDRLAAGELAIGRALTDLLPVLDDIERAREHGDLTGGLKAISDALELAFSKLGLEAFGDPGDAFDPTVHEAVMHDESEDVTVPTCTTVLRKGYRYGERLLRPAMVGVSDPSAPPGLGSNTAQDDRAGISDEPAGTETGE